MYAIFVEMVIPRMQLPFILYMWIRASFRICLFYMVWTSDVFRE